MCWVIVKQLGQKKTVISKYESLRLMNKLILPILCFFSYLSLQAQVGGDNVYEFINLPSSARISALGGNLITVSDDDVALAFNNPAALNPSMHQQLSFNYNFHLTGISNGYAAYGHHINKWETTLHGGIQYLNYGTFDATDERGNIIGSFKAAEYAITLGAGYRLYEKLSLGANVKVITSQFETYNSTGLVSDFAAMYNDTSGRFNATLLFKNVGTQLSTYRTDNKEPIPFDVQLGVSQRLKHLPLRFSLIAHNLQRWNIIYDDPDAEEATLFIGETQNTENEFGMWVDNLFRHVIFNGEFLFGARENFRLRFGYNHFRKRELSVRNLRSLAGFSFGVGLKIKKFRIEFGKEIYHLAGGTNHLSISTNLGEFGKIRN